MRQILPVLLFLCCVLVSPAAAADDALMVGVLDGDMRAAAADFSERLAGQLQNTVRVKAFEDADTLLAWLERYRMIDFAVVSEPVLSRATPGSYHLLGSVPSRSHMSAPVLVAHWGVPAEHLRAAQGLLSAGRMPGAQDAHRSLPTARTASTHEDPGPSAGDNAPAVEKVLVDEEPVVAGGPVSPASGRQQRDASRREAEVSRDNSPPESPQTSPRLLPPDSAVAPGEPMTIHLFPLTRVMLPEEVDIRLLEQFSTLLQQQEEAGNIRFIEMTSSFGEAEPGWLERNHSLTGAIFGYRDKAGLFSRRLQLRGRLYYRPPAEVGPARQEEAAVSVSFDADGSSLAAAQNQLVEKLARRLIAAFLEEISEQ